jgi:signal transduction histidine kinase
MRLGNGPSFSRTVRDLIAAGRAYLDTDHLARLLPGIVRALEVAGGRRLRDLVAERARLEIELLEIADGERQRLGSELHDDLGQLLAAVGLLATDLETALARRGAAEAGVARRIREIVELAIGHTSRLARGLATVDLDHGQLAAALEGLAIETRSLFAVACRARIAGEPPALAAATAHHLYKIAQEAVTNAIKHGRPTAVEIGLEIGRDAIVLTVRNDGEPFPAAAAESRRMGLRYMRHRAHVIGATVTIAPERGCGTRVRCVLPRTNGAAASARPVAAEPPAG